MYIYIYSMTCRRTVMDAVGTVKLVTLINSLNNYRRTADFENRVNRNVRNVDVCSPDDRRSRLNVPPCSGGIRMT